MSYNSKYKGAEVEELLDSIGNKVDKVDGKQLSTEDFTTLLKQKLEGLSNYDDNDIQFAISQLRGDLDWLVSGDTTTAIKSFNEIIAFLDGIEDSQSLDSIIASIEQQIAAKYTKPSTGIPKSDLASAVQTSLGKADTALQSYTEQYKGTVTGVKMNGTTKNPSSGVVDLGTVITAHQDLSNYQPKLVSGTNIKTINGESILGSGDLVIESGSDDIYYLDTSGLASEGVVTAEEFEKIKKCSALINRVFIDGYTYPIISIVYTQKADMAAFGVADVVFSYIAANDTNNSVVSLLYFTPNEDGSANYETNSDALYTFKTVNGESILGEGDITIEGGGDYLPLTGGTITGDLKVDNELTAGRVRANEIASDYGSRIYIDRYGFSYNDNGKRIDFTYAGNGTKFLSDDGTYKEVSGGGSSSGSSAYPLVEHGTSDTTFTLTPNTFHVWDEVASLDLSLGTETSGVANEYLFQFTSGSTATTLTLPSDIKLANDTAPTIAANMTYQVSILKGLACVLAFSNAAALIENNGTYSAGTMMSGATLTFEYPVASDLTINLMYHATGSVVMPAGETSITIDWFEPQAPVITSIIPSEDSVYQYIY